MKQKYFFILRTNFVLPILAILSFASCKPSRELTTSRDQLQFNVENNPSGFNFANLSDQTANVARQPKSRGLVDGTIVSLASNGIKQIIKARQKKYFARFNASLTDLNFYNNLSTSSQFDPVGIQFASFKLIRLTVNSKGEIDTAFSARFVLDTSKGYEILNASTFRLKLDELDYRLPKVKYKRDGKVNLDFQITFSSSYIDNSGSFFNDVVLGNFFLTLRDVPLRKDEAFDYFKNISGKMLDGKCFLVPRSLGYYVSSNKQILSCFGYGQYSLQVTVSESSKSSFIETLIFQHQNLVDNAASQGFKNLVGQMKKVKKKNNNSTN